MILYLDASAIVALVLADDTATAITLALNSAEQKPWISDFGWGELVSATGRRVRARMIRRSVAQRSLDAAALLFALPERAIMMSSDISDATIMLQRFDIPLKLPDALHIAIARRLGASLISTDRQQVSAAKKLGVDCLNPLEEVP